MNRKQRNKVSLNPLKTGHVSDKASIKVSSVEVKSQSPKNGACFRPVWIEETWKVTGLNPLKTGHVSDML